MNVIVTIVIFICVVVLSTIFSMLYRGIDRKLVARMQGRVGPPIIQPFRDVQKLLMKENIVPDGAVSWLFTAAPFVCLIASALLLLYIPLFGQKALLGGFGGAILVIYLLILPSLAYVLGGFASSSPYATVGAQREMVIMMSYELPLAVAVVTLAWRIGHAAVGNPFMFSTIAQYPIWNSVGPLGVIGSLVLLFTLLVVTPGEAAKVPFDIAEAETEIAGGLLVEYSGRNLCLFYLADIVKAFAMGSLVVALFFPYNLSPVIGIGTPVVAGIVDGLFFLIKVFAVMFISISVIRAGMARFKISQASWVYIIAMTLISLVGLILISLDLMVS
ncbi:MAG: NADH-quinone oxidoreductase subunit H [Dehalococcoidia bacterium]|nr:MAG: NADH-quinone oxidoreductase subunit H [Dehalococcoidia bacterium]